MTRLYDRLGEVFDKAAQAGELIEHNVYFYLMAIQGMCEKAHWREAIETARTALMIIKPSDSPSNMSDAQSREIIVAIILTSVCICDNSAMWHISINAVRRGIYVGIIAREYRSMLADAYEQVSDFSMAFETVEFMFMESPSFELYKRARVLSEKSGNFSSFLSGAEELMKRTQPRFAFSCGHLLLI